MTLDGIEIPDIRGFYSYAFFLDKNKRTIMKLKHCTGDANQYYIDNNKKRLYFFTRLLEHDKKNFFKKKLPVKNTIKTKKIIFKINLVNCFIF